jgi:WD40 repeat protein
VTSDSHANLWDSKAFFKVPPKLMGHRDRITATGFLKEGRQVITASDDGEVKIWDIANGDRIVPLRYHVKEIGAVTFSTDGKLFATGDWDGEIAIWETNPLGLLTDFKASKDEIYSLAFDSDCRSLLVGDSAGQLMKWTLDDPKPVWARTVSSSPIQFIDFDNQTRRLATDHSDGVAILSADSGETLQVLQSESGTPFYPCGFSDDGNYWTGQENPGPVVTWDLRTGAFTSKNSEEVPTLGIANSFDKSIVLNAGDADDLSVYDTRLREILCRFHGFQLGYTKFWLSRDGSRLLMTHISNVLKLFDTETGEELNAINLPTFDSIEDFAISPQEDLIILKGENGQLAALPLFQPERILLDPSVPENMMAHQFDQSSKRLLVELTNDSLVISKVRLFDLQSRRLGDIDLPSPQKAEGAKLSMDGRLLAVTSVKRDENLKSQELEVCVWDVSNLENPQVIQRISMKAIDVAISKCCRYMAFEKGDHSVTCRELSGDRVLEIPSASSGRRLAFAPTRPTLAIRSSDSKEVSIVDFESQIWDVTTIEIIDQAPLAELLFDWTGSKVIARSFQQLEPRDERSSVSYRYFVSIWDVNTRKRLYLSEGTQSRATPATGRNYFSPIESLLSESSHYGPFLADFDWGLACVGAISGCSENSVVFSDRDRRVLIWDQASGKVESSNVGWKFDPTRVSPDGRWHFWKGRLTDLNYGQSREIVTFRQLKSQSSVNWHVSHIKRAINHADGHAIRFHLSRLPHILGF